MIEKSDKMSLTFSPLRPASPYKDERIGQKLVNTAQIITRMYWVWKTKGIMESYFDTGLTNGSLNTGVTLSPTVTLRARVSIVSFGPLENTHNRVTEMCSV